MPSYSTQDYLRKNFFGNMATHVAYCLLSVVKDLKHVLIEKVDHVFRLGFGLK